MNRRLPVIAILTVCLLLIFALPVFGTGFSDTQGHWAEDQINKWAGKGLAEGYPDGTFRPDDTITRAEFLKLANGAFNYTEEAVINYSDVLDGDWFAGDVKKSQAAGFINGYPDGSMKPNNPVSRQEAATIISKIGGLTADPDHARRAFTDYNNIADWSIGYIGAAAEAGYMVGYPDGSFGPSSSMTRAESLVALSRLQEGLQVIEEADNGDEKVWIIDGAGAYGPEEETSTFAGDVYIRADGVVLQNIIISGDLIIAEEVGQGAVTLNSVTVEGDTYIRGGGADSIYINGGDFNNIIVQKAGGKLRIVMVNETGARVIVAEEAQGTEIIFEGTFDSIDVKTGDITLTFRGETTVSEINIDEGAENVVIKTSEDTVIDVLTVNTTTHVTNEGRIKEALGTAAEGSEY